MNSMKLLQNLPAFTKAIIVAGMLGACQNEKDALVNPVAEQAKETNEPNNEKTNVAYFYKRLISDGLTALYYTGPYKLLSYESHPGLNAHTDYDYANPNIIYARKKNSSTSAIIETSAYSLNAAGKCTESHHVKNGVTEVYFYKYTPEGRLEQFYKKSNPNDRQEFSYVNNGSGNFNLSTIKFFDSKGQLYKQSHYYYYKDEEDAAKLNPASIAIGRAKYLPIFGNFNFNSIRQIDETNYTNQATSSTVNREFSYTWNEDTQTVIEKNSIGVISTKRKFGKLGIL